MTDKYTANDWLYWRHTNRLWWRKPMQKPSLVTLLPGASIQIVHWWDEMYSDMHHFVTNAWAVLLTIALDDVSMLLFNQFQWVDPPVGWCRHSKDASNSLRKPVHNTLFSLSHQLGRSLSLIRSNKHHYCSFTCRPHCLSTWSTRAATVKLWS